MTGTKIDIIYEDEDLVVVNKPAGLLSIPDRFHPDKPNTWQVTAKMLKTDLWVVHRLDKDTSGLLCLAKNEKAHQHLNEQFQKRTVKKTYLALVSGHLTKGEPLEVSQSIKEHPTKLGTMIAVSKGKPALTHFKVLENFKRYTLVKAIPVSGRTHQIRVHLKSIGHPLMIDPIYGNEAAFYLSAIKGRKYSQKKQTEEKPLMSRLTLHASTLDIIHPSTGLPKYFEAPLPKDFKAVVNQLRKWDCP